MVEQRSEITLKILPPPIKEQTNIIPFSSKVDFNAEAHEIVAIPPAFVEREHDNMREHETRKAIRFIGQQNMLPALAANEQDQQDIAKMAQKRKERQPELARRFYQFLGLKFYNQAERA